MLITTLLLLVQAQILNRRRSPAITKNQLDACASVPQFLHKQSRTCSELFTGDDMVGTAPLIASLEFNRGSTLCLRKRAQF